MCLKHKVFSVPIYQTKDQTRSRRREYFTLWWRWITSTYSSSYSLEGTLYSCFLTWGIWTIKTSVIPISHGKQPFSSKKRLTAHPAQKRRQLLENAHVRMQGSEKVQYWQLYSPYLESGVVEVLYIPGAPLPFQTWSSWVFDVFATTTGRRMSVTLLKQDWSTNQTLPGG